MLGADTRGAGPGDAGPILAGRLVELMKACGMPNGLRAVGYSEADVPALVKGAWPQQRLLRNNPVEDLRPEDLDGMFRNALSYW